MDKIESTKKIYYDVLPAYNIDTALTYSSNQVFKVGSLVKISIRKKIFPGCILNIYQHKPKINFKVKDIEVSDNYFYLDKKKIDFLKWVSEYNFISFVNIVYGHLFQFNMKRSNTNLVLPTMDALLETWKPTKIIKRSKSMNLVQGLSQFKHMDYVSEYSIKPQDYSKPRRTATNAGSFSKAGETMYRLESSRGVSSPTVKYQLNSRRASISRATNLQGGKKRFIKKRPSAVELNKTKAGGTPYGASHVENFNSSSELSREEYEIAKKSGVRIAKLINKLNV